jgi:gamma-tubulin complex component 3
MEKYLRIFNFLWRLKRVEYALSASWQTMKPNTMALLEKRLGAPGRKLVGELRRCQVRAGVARGWRDETD